jgi:DNA polymerase V
VLLERTVRKHQQHLSGATQQIACTRSFGHSINVLPSLIEAVSEFYIRYRREAASRQPALKIWRR